MKTDWIRVTRNRICIICLKGDWCLVAADGSAAICQRVKSDKRIGTAGYLHRLTDDARISPRRIYRCPRPKIQRDWPALAAKYHNAMTDNGWPILVDELGLTVETLKAMQIGWDGSQSRYTFPMRNPDGVVVGIRTRQQDGKRSVSGSDGNGLFFVPSMLSAGYLIICEGPTDTAALIDAGFGSSVGKPSCRLGDQYVLNLIRRLRPEVVLLIPDSDTDGLEGFSYLANSILQSGAMSLDRIDSLTPPIPLKDIRQWLQKNREHLAGHVAAKLKQIKLRSGGSSNE